MPINKEAVIKEAATLKGIKNNYSRVVLDLNNVENYLSILEERFGTIEELDYAGYILPNGKFLNLLFEGIPLNHHDVLFFGFKDEEILDAGAIRLGECEYAGYYFAEIKMAHFKPTKKQYEKLDELLMKSPENKLFIEARTSIIINKDMNFVKMYNFLNGDTSKNIQYDLNNYEKGDKTYVGNLDEYTGEELRPDK